MKTIADIKLIILFIVFLALTSCQNDDDFGANIADNGVLVNFLVNTQLNESIGDVSLPNVTIQLTNTITGEIFETQTNSEGVALFDNIDSGEYAVLATLTLTNEAFETLFGYSSSSENVTFTGAQESAVVNVNTTSTTIQLNSGTIGDLLIKQVYYAGSHIINGAGFRDQFIEIYNNSNEIIYADGLLIAQIFGSTSSAIYDYTLDNGQYDWSKSSTDTIGSAANTDYVYADFIFRIPGDGTTYPINPGEEIIIAATAANHKAPLVDNDGIELSVADPSLTVDLSNADFEGYIGAYREAAGDFPASWDIQNTSVPDLEIVYYKSGQDVIFNTFGYDGFVIFNHDSPETLPKYAHPNTESSDFFVQIPNEFIIDAVETNNPDATNLYPKQMPTHLDAGYASVPNGVFSSQSIIRKVAAEINGRKILADTNNSSADFTYLEMAEPNAFAE